MGKRPRATSNCNLCYLRFIVGQVREWVKRKESGVQRSDARSNPKFWIVRLLTIVLWPLTSSVHVFLQIWRTECSREETTPNFQAGIVPWRCDQEHIPGPAAKLCIVSVPHLSAVAEPIPMLISTFRLLVG